LELSGILQVIGEYEKIKKKKFFRTFALSHFSPKIMELVDKRTIERQVGSQIVKHMWLTEIDAVWLRERWNKNQLEYPQWAIQMVMGAKEPTQVQLQVWKLDIVSALKSLHPYCAKLYWSLRTLYGNNTFLQSFEEPYFDAMTKTHDDTMSIISNCVELEKLALRDLYASQNFEKVSQCSSEIQHVLEQTDPLGRCLWWEGRCIETLTDWERSKRDKDMRSLASCEQMQKLKAMILTPMSQLGLKKKVVPVVQFDDTSGDSESDSEIELCVICKKRPIQSPGSHICNKRRCLKKCEQDKVQ
jgi:hypothetical protein